MSGQVVANLLHTRYSEVRLVTPKEETKHNEEIEVDVQLIRSNDNASQDGGDGLEDLLVQAVSESHRHYAQRRNAPVSGDPLKLEGAIKRKQSLWYREPWIVALVAFSATELLLALRRSKF